MDTSLEPLVDDELWRRSGRPMRGQLLRFYIGAAIMAAAYFVPLNSPGFWALICGGIVFIVLFPPVVERFVLAPLSKRVGAAKKSEVQGLLGELREKRMVQLFAPNAWLPLQEARLHWRRRDGRAAAKSFTEVLRHTKVDGPHALWSAEGQAHLLAGDRRAAKAAIDRVPEDSMGGRDHLARGVLLLSESGKNDEAVSDLEAAHADLGDHARVLAGLALGLQRANREADAADFLLQAEALLETDARLNEAGAGGLDDPMARDLAKRARKGLRSYLKRRDQGEKKAKRARPDRADDGLDAAVPASDAPVDKARKSKRAGEKTEKSKRAKKEKKSSKKARKQARREARKQAKAEERARKQAEREAAQREAEDRRREEVEAAIAGGSQAAPAVGIKPTPVVPKPAAVTASKPMPKPVVPKAPAAVEPKPAAARPATPKLAPAAAKPVPKPAAPKLAPTAAKPVPKPAAPKLAPAAPMVAPTVPEARAGADPFAPPVVAPGKKAPGKGLFAPPSFAPPKAAPKPKDAGDDGWGDAFGGIDLPPPPTIAPPAPKPVKSEDDD